MSESRAPESAPSPLTPADETPAVGPHRRGVQFPQTHPIAPAPVTPPPHTVDGFVKEFLHELNTDLGVALSRSSINDQYTALAHTVRNYLTARWLETSRKQRENSPKSVAYLSAEYLLGRQLGNNLLGTTNTTSGSYTAAGNANCDRNTTCTSIFDTRWKNAIAYVSPTFAGLNVTAAYVANENKTFNNNGFGTAYNPSNTKGYDVGLKYANGPAMAAVTYNAVSLGNEANTDVSDFRVGASYDFGMASIRGIFDRARADHFGGAGYTQNVFGLGGTFNVTPAGKIIGQFYFADEMKRNGKDQKDTGAKLFEIGYEHSLSKRTMLELSFAQTNADNQDNDARTISLGMEHKF